jgi:ADP-glucose pyrophosphorylase
MGDVIKNFHLERKSANKQIADSAEIDEKSFIANGCVIGEQTKIINSTLGKNVEVEDGVIIKDSVIWKGTRINHKAKISGSIIGYDCIIGENVVIVEGTVLGDKTNVS